MDETRIREWQCSWENEDGPRFLGGSLVSDKPMFMFIHNQRDTPKITNKDFIHKDVHLKAEKEASKISTRMLVTAFHSDPSSISSGKALQVYKYSYNR